MKDNLDTRDFPTTAGTPGLRGNRPRHNAEAVQRLLDEGAIVLGKGGRQIRDMGTAARAELEAITERKVHLFVHVKVREGWQDDRERYREMGLDFDA